MKKSQEIKNIKGYLNLDYSTVYIFGEFVSSSEPWFMVNGFAHGSRIMVLFMVLFMVWFMVHDSEFMVSFIMFFLNMVDYPVFFPSMSTLTLTLDTIVTLSGA